MGDRETGPEELGIDLDRVVNHLARYFRGIAWVASRHFHRVFYFSPFCEAILGVSLEEARSNPRMFLSRVHPEDRERVAEIIDDETRMDWTCLYRLIDRFGHVRWLRENGGAILDPNGHELAIGGFSEDVTEIIQIQEELRRITETLSQILEFFPDPTLVIDQNERVIVWNRAMEALTNTPRAEVLEKGPEIYCPVFYGEARPLLANLVLHPDMDIKTEHGVLTREGDALVEDANLLRLRSRRGPYFWIRALRIMNPDSSTAGAIEIFRDVTLLHLADDMIRHQAELLRQPSQAKRA